jgi:hypothetical protein
MGKHHVWAGLAFGTVSYCLVLLVSQDAKVFTLALMGTLALGTIALSMLILWRRRPDEAPECSPELKNAQMPEFEENLNR